ncbi:N-acetylmuramoyl-L-alanine amidase [Luteococcus sp. Sow4_B9]|uniref:N-acetylmuramoyl-L-alanine amidase n=1 Tax=Luteococcus sp. Sow4_B9 TaxID=3438792 RepID=UPI003F961E06
MSTRLLGLGLATTALLCGQLPAPATAHLPAAPVPMPAAPAPQDPDAGLFPLTPDIETVTVDGQPRRVLAALSPTTVPLTMVGLTWTGLQGNALLQLRVRTDAGWQAWETHDLEALPGETTGRKGSDPIFTGAALAVEARVLTSPTAPATINDPQLAVIDSREVSADENLQATQPRVSSAAASATAPQPAIVTRAGWGADESLLTPSCVKPNVATTIKAAIVHHTAGSNSYTAAQSASQVRGIYAYHVKTLGWCDIGYNFLVDKYGTIFEGRHGGMDAPIRGAHATSWNTDTVGISVMMNSQTARQSDASMASVSKVLAWKLAGNYRDPNSKLTLAGKYINRIARHGDVMSTACPGTNITAAMPSLRSQVTAAMGEWKTPIYQEWVSQGGESGKLGSPHLLERPWNGGRTTTFTKGGVYLTSSGQTHWMDAAIDARYRQSDAFQTLGWPQGDQTLDSATGANVVRFDKGSIHSSPTTGTHLTTGVLDTWLRKNPSLAARLGAPTGAMVSQATGSTQSFANGTVTVIGSTISTPFGNFTADASIDALKELEAYTPGTPPSGKVADLDGNRRADILTAPSGSTLQWYPTTSQLQPGPARAGSSLGMQVNWISHLPDLDGDGHSDLVARRTDGSLWAWKGAGHGQYTAPRQVGWNWNGMREITLMPDMTRDGLPELVGVSGDHRLMRYTLGRDLRVTSTATIGWNWGAIKQLATVGDIRSAGVVDLLAVTNSGALLTYHGSSSGTLTGRYQQIGHGWQDFTDIGSVGDVHDDGRWDLAGHRASGPLLVYGNKGGGSWQRPVAMLPEVRGLGPIA